MQRAASGGTSETKGSTLFSLTYMRRELTRRAGRTILTVLGLSVGVALVVAITAVANGLDDAQQGVLNPLKSVGTDLLVTRPVAASAATATNQSSPTTTAAGAAGANGTAPNGRPGGFNNRNGSGLSPEDEQALLAENSSVLTDLSKLGNPGDHFVHDFFLPGTQLTFPSDEASKVAAIPGVTGVAQGLTLVAQHQEGTVPQIVAQIQTGGEEIQVEQQITPPTPEEEAQIRQCIDQLRASGQAPAGPQNQPGQGGQQAGDGQGRGFGGAFAQCLPDRMRTFRGTIRTPERTIQQALNPPQTDITTESYTISGVDPATPDLGLITPAQIVEGSFFATAPANGTKEAVLAEAYASRKGLAVGSTLSMNGNTYTVVGLAQPPLGGQAADVYLPLGELQTLANRAGRANVLLVRSDNAADVAAIGDQIKATFTGSTVTSAKDLADRVSGSLVDAANLANRLGRVLAVVVLVAAFCVAALLTLSSVAKRVRELGTLKAIGWRQGRVVRQIVGETVVQGVLGGIVGAGLGIAAAVAASHLVPDLTATAPGTASAGTVFGLGSATSAASSAAIHLSAPVHAGVLLAALGLAVFGGLLAGAAGALRAARLRPADALRELG